MTAMRKSMATAIQTANTEIAAFPTDEATANAIRECRLFGDRDGDVHVAKDLTDTIEFLSTLPTPECLIVDLGSETDIMPLVERLSEVCDPDSHVVLIGAVNDLRLYRQLIGMGIVDYLVKPISAQSLDETFERLTLSRSETSVVPNAPTKTSQSKVVAVIGARGGAGASTIAANLASLISTTHDKRTTLIDMDLTFGTQAVAFDVEPGPGLSDAMTEPGRMDELFIKRASTRVSVQLQLMATETDLARGDIASAEALSSLLEYVRGDAEIIVVDLPRSTLVRHSEMLKEFDQVLLVSEPTLSSMRDCARLRTLISETNPEAQISVVLSKLGASAKEEVPTSVFEEGAGSKVAHKVVFDPKATLNAEVNGKCVAQAAPRTKIGKDLCAIAKAVVGESHMKKRRNLLEIFALAKHRKNDSVERA